MCENEKQPHLRFHDIFVKIVVHSTARDKADVLSSVFHSPPISNERTTLASKKQDILPSWSFSFGKQSLGKLNADCFQNCAMAHNTQNTHCI